MYTYIGTLCVAKSMRKPGLCAYTKFDHIFGFQDSIRAETNSDFCIQILVMATDWIFKYLFCNLKLLWCIQNVTSTHKIITWIYVDFLQAI